MEIMISGLEELVGGITALLAVLFSGFKLIIHYSNKALVRKIDGVKTEVDIIKINVDKGKNENSEQHERIFKTLSVVEDSVVRKEIIEELRAIARGYIHYNKLIDTKAKILIDAQCERTVEVAEEIMNEQFTQEVLEQALVKIDAGCAKGRQQAYELYGQEFLEEYTSLQRAALDQLLPKLHKIVADGVTNSKYAKFKCAATAFLHDVISETLLLIHNKEK